VNNIDIAMTSTPVHIFRYARANTNRGGRKQTGSPTATLRREILLTPALSFTLSLKVSLGKSTLPYAVPGQKKINNRLNVLKMKLNGTLINRSCLDILLHVTV